MLLTGRDKILAFGGSGSLVLLAGSCGSGFRGQGSGFRVQGSGSRVQGSGFRVQGSVFRVLGAGFRVQSAGLPHRDLKGPGVGEVWREGHSLVRLLHQCNDPGRRWFLRTLRKSPE